MNPQCDIGLIGLAVMGQNLVLNMADHGFKVAVYNRTTSKVDEFLADSAKGKSVMGCKSPGELVDNLKKPRRIMLMVKAGNPVGQTIRQFAPLLEAGDIIIDGGNSFFEDTDQRKELAKKGILFIGTGISGGEEGARTGSEYHARGCQRGLAPCPGDFSKHFSQSRSPQRYPLL